MTPHEHQLWALAIDCLQDIYERGQLLACHTAHCGCTGCIAEAVLVQISELNEQKE